MNALLAATLCSIVLSSVVLSSVPAAAAAYVLVRRSDKGSRRRHR